MILITLLTVIVYILAKSFSHKLGSIVNHPPLYDVSHHILPNLSKYVYIRDYILILTLLPILFLKQTWIYIPEFWNCFMIIIFIKAISIFFTYIPSSHPSCQNPHFYDLNHCRHQSVSGHAALFLLIGFLYIKAGFNKYFIYISIFLYCIIILTSRAHYALDVIHGILFTYLITC